MQNGGIYLFMSLITWVREMGYKNVVFELDEKLVVDAVRGSSDGITEYSKL